MKISLTAMLLLCLLTTIAFAQEDTQTKRSEFGISIGVNIITSSIKSHESTTRLYSKVKPGHSLGILYRYRLSGLLVLRTQAELSFFNLEFSYYSDHIKLIEKREMLNVELPIHLVFEKAYKKGAPFISIGGRYRFDLGVKEFDYTTFNGMIYENISRYRKNDILLDVGIGIALKTERLTLKPEFVYSRGLLHQSGGPLNPLLESVYSNQFTLRFLFYGA